MWLPDVNSLLEPAEIFGISVDELMQIRTEIQQSSGKKTIHDYNEPGYKAIALVNRKYEGTDWLRNRYLVQSFAFYLSVYESIKSPHRFISADVHM